ncbi:hypothetical protein E2320_000354, partial [Naja naja]
TKLVFYVQNQPPHQIFKGRDVAWTLKSELRKQQSDFLIFRALEINTVTCQLNCSDHGLCDSFTKRCICDPFWMENFIKVQIGDGESNCEWSVLYVVIASFVILVSLGIFSWVPSSLGLTGRKEAPPWPEWLSEKWAGDTEAQKPARRDSIATGLCHKELANDTKDHSLPPRLHEESWEYHCLQSPIISKKTLSQTARKLSRFTIIYEFRFPELEETRRCLHGKRRNCIFDWDVSRTVEQQAALPVKNIDMSSCKKKSYNPPLHMWKMRRKRMKNKYAAQPVGALNPFELESWLSLSSFPSFQQ